MNRRDIGSWLEGPPKSKIQNWPGERLGRPETGKGSVARVGRRFVGLVIDWAIALLIARFAFGNAQWATIAVFAVEQFLLVGTLGYGIGHRIVGIRVQRLDGSWAGPLRAVLRTVLLCLVVPAAVWDADQRGLHDKAAGTVLVRI